MNSKKGFTLIELLICITLVSIVIVFLFRLINDIRNENNGGAYIKEVYVMKNEIMSKMNSIIVDYGICHSSITSHNNQVDVDLTLCNSEHMYLTVKEKSFRFAYNGDEQLYKIKNSNTWIDLDYVENNEIYQDYELYTLTFPTHKKGVKDNVIDDISFSYSSKRNTTNITSLYSCTTCDCEYTIEEDATYIVELWGEKGEDGTADVAYNYLPQNEKDVLDAYFSEAHPGECYFSSPDCEGTTSGSDLNDICQNKWRCTNGPNGSYDPDEWNWRTGGTCRCFCGATISCPSGFHGDGCSDCRKNYTTYGGAGGYTYGELELKKGDKIYIGCSLGSDNVYGYASVKGGDGIFLATEKIGSGKLEEYENYKDKVLLVAGGGGGASDCLPHPDIVDNQNEAAGKPGGTAKSSDLFGKGNYCGLESSFCGGNGGGGYWGGSAGSGAWYSCYASSYDVKDGGNGGTGYINTKYVKNGVQYTLADYTDNTPEFRTLHTDCSGYSQSKCANVGSTYARISKGVLKS